MLPGLLLALALAAPAAAGTTHERTGERRPLALVGAIHLQAPSPFLALGGRLGLGMIDRVSELGAEAALFWFPKSDEAYGLQVGGYAQIGYPQLVAAPASWVRRLYLHVRVYRAFARGTPRFDAWGAGWGLGFRLPCTLLGSRHLLFELGVQRAWLFRYREALWMLDVIKLGLAF
jgi:hypothetical protein